jgi:hypothetical protein
VIHCKRDTDGFCVTGVFVPNAPSKNVYIWLLEPLGIKRRGGHLANPHLVHDLLLVSPFFSFLPDAVLFSPFLDHEPKSRRPSFILLNYDTTMIAGFSKAVTLYLAPVLYLTALLLSLFAFLAPAAMLHDRVALLTVTPSLSLTQPASSKAVDGASLFLGVLGTYIYIHRDLQSRTFADGI